MKYGIRAVPVHVLITERDEINVSGLAKTLHLLWLIDWCGGKLTCLEGKLKCPAFCMPLLMVWISGSQSGLHICVTWD